MINEIEKRETIIMPKRKKLTTYLNGKPDIKDLEKEVNHLCFKGFILEFHMASGRKYEAEYYFSENVLMFSSMLACFKEAGYIQLPNRIELQLDRVDAIQIKSNLPDVIASHSTFKTLYDISGSDFLATTHEEIAYLQTLPQKIEKTYLNWVN